MLIFKRDQITLHKYLKRALIEKIKTRQEYNPVVALLGPRQCGKTTVAKIIAEDTENAIYVDLENPESDSKLSDPLLFLKANREKLIVIDEIQYRPNLFPVLRSYIDSVHRECQILILGSASRDLIRQGAESLAGRISFMELTPFVHEEVSSMPLTTHWERGGFPLSLLAKDSSQSAQWRRDYLKSIIERDLPLAGLPLSPINTQRMLSMLAHTHGEISNTNRLGESLGVTGKSIKSYLDFLEGTFMIRRLLPYTPNLKKRLVKSPKFYFRDSGILHTILHIDNFNTLLGHPVTGNSWEGFAIEQIISQIAPEWESYFFRTQVGAELDLLLIKGNIKIAIECKASTAPNVTRGFWNCLNDLQIPAENSWIVCPIDEQFPFKNGSTVGGISQVVDFIRKI